MPVTKTAKKEMRSSARKAVRNKSVRSMCKSSITRAERLIFAGDLEAAEKAVVTAVSTLDKAANKGIIHPNNAARRKQRLMKKLNQLKPSAEPEPQAEAS
ncbi:MAG: 30S ribosomal protein S20 [Dehalococcoidales bacterium]|nr:MAG: 30S ribosomal protein S20 [Dehalococcoidales bacterium]